MSVAVDATMRQQMLREMGIMPLELRTSRSVAEGLPLAVGVCVLLVPRLARDDVRQARLLDNVRAAWPETEHRLELCWVDGDAVADPQGAGCVLALGVDVGGARDRLWCLPSLAELLGDGAGKRRLWQALHSARLRLAE